MLKIVGDSPKGNALTELILLDDKFRPTPLLLGLVALELCTLPSFQTFPTIIVSQNEQKINIFKVIRKNFICFCNVYFI